jgi:hypothetical protein
LNNKEGSLFSYCDIMRRDIAIFLGIIVLLGVISFSNGLFPLSFLGGGGTFNVPYDGAYDITAMYSSPSSEEWGYLYYDIYVNNSYYNNYTVYVGGGQVASVPIYSASNITDTKSIMVNWRYVHQG